MSSWGEQFAGNRDKAKLQEQESHIEALSAELFIRFGNGPQ